MRTTNSAGFSFYWPEGSNIVEVFRKGDPPFAPFEAIWAGDLQRNESNLNRLANEDSAYSRRQ